MAEYGGPNLWQICEAHEGRIAETERKQAVIETRLSSIEKSQARIIGLLTAVLVAIVASGIGAVLTVLLTRKG